jgi:hypothetical protein
MGVVSADLFDGSSIIEASVTLSSVALTTANGTRVAPAASVILAKAEVPDIGISLRRGVTLTLNALAIIQGSATAKYAQFSTVNAAATVALNRGGVVRYGLESLTGRATVRLENAAHITFIGAGSVTGVVGSRSIELTPVEIRMLQPFTTPALEEFRRRALNSTVQVPSPIAGVRTVSVLALSTDQRGMFTNLLGPSATLLTATDVERRRLIEVDQDLRVLDAVRTRALTELGALGAPPAYLEALDARLKQSAYATRVIAVCGVVLFAALLLQD